MCCFSYFFYYSKNPEFKSCRSCVGLTEKCPRQNVGATSTCTIPDALDLVKYDGFMLIKVNSSNPVGRNSSANMSLDLYNLGRCQHFHDAKLQPH